LQEINNRSGVHYLVPTPADEKAFGPYLAHYTLIMDFAKDMRAQSESFAAHVMKLGVGPGSSHGFWAEQAKRIDWIKPFTKVKNTSFAPGNISIKWFEDGVLNVAYNCIDRHLPKRGDQTAIIWEGDDPKESKHITYRELHDEVCRFANVLRTRTASRRATASRSICR
jgi:hypothetical protein